MNYLLNFKKIVIYEGAKLKNNYYEIDKNKSYRIG